jgi:predicted Zn-dependent peptidase
MGAGNDLISIGDSQNLLQTLKNLPDVRPEQVARAAKLVADPSYPSDEVLGKVADALAGGSEN